MIIEKILKPIWNEFVYGGHLSSLGASGILWSSAIIFDKPVSIPLLIIGYVISQIVYGYNHFREAGKDLLTNPERVSYIEKIKKFVPFLLIFYFLLFIVLLIYLKNIKSILVALFILIGGLLFTDIFKDFTKQIIGFKTFYGPFFWAMGVILASSYYGIQDNLLIFFLFLFLFLRDIVNTTFFDIKDIESDKKGGLKTFAVVFGKKKILNYLHFFNAFSFFPIILGVYYNILPSFILLLSLFYFYSFYYLNEAKKENIEKIRKLSYIMVDGEYLFWPIILFLGKLL